jgi:Sec-independent protein translocase protein TatA
MFDSIGTQEIFFIVVIALVVVGPKDLVRVAGKMGRMLGEIKRQLAAAQGAVQKEVDQAMEREALQKIEADNRRIMIETGVLDQAGQPAPAAALAGGAGTGAPETDKEKPH